MTFQGYTQETVDFLWGIRFNNERAWFEAHKEIYLTHFYQPMRELGDELYDYIAAKRPDLGLIRKVTRIYRDVRRLHGRGDERHDDVTAHGRETDDAGVPLLIGLEVHAHERSALVERRAVHRAGLLVHAIHGANLTIDFGAHHGEPPYGFCECHSATFCPMVISCRNPPVPYLITFFCT